HVTGNMRRLGRPEKPDDPTAPPARPRRLRTPLTGHLPFADAPGVADPIEVTSRWLTRGGRPWFPASGEFHYSRFPAARWEEELLKMKAAGVTAVASYVWCWQRRTGSLPNSPWTQTR